MILTEKHLMEYYSMSAEQVKNEVDRIRKADRGDVLFVINKPTDQDRIDTLVAMAEVPAYWAVGSGYASCIKGPVQFEGK